MYYPVALDNADIFQSLLDYLKDPSELDERPNYDKYDIFSLSFSDNFFPCLS